MKFLRLVERDGEKVKRIMWVNVAEIVFVDRIDANAVIMVTATGNRILFRTHDFDKQFATFLKGGDGFKSMEVSNLYIDKKG
jgi:hypothetical protein